MSVCVCVCKSFPRVDTEICFVIIEKKIVCSDCLHGINVIGTCNKE